MFEGLRKAISSLWAESNVFKSIIIATLFFFTAVAASLLVVYGRILLGIIFPIIMIVAKLVIGILFHKRGYVKKVKETAPKEYYTVRRVKRIMCGGLLTGFGGLLALQVLYGPLPHIHSWILYLSLFVVGVLMTDTLERSLRKK